MEVSPAVAGAHDVRVKGITGGGHRLGCRERPTEWAGGRRSEGRLAEMLDEPPNHAHRRRPGAVGRADRLHDVLEDRQAADHPTRALCRPRELGVELGERVEGREVLVEAEHMAHGGKDRRVRPRARQATLDPHRGAPRLPGLDTHEPRAACRHGHGQLEGALVLVNAHRRKLDETVREDRAPEIDGLAAGPDELERTEPPRGSSR